MGRTISEATKLSIQCPIEGEVYKEPMAIYVIDSEVGLWRRLKPLVYRNQEKKDSRDIIKRGIVGDEDTLYLFRRDLELEHLLQPLVGDGNGISFDTGCHSDRDGFVEEENQSPDELPLPKKIVKKPRQTVPGELPDSFK